MNNQEIIDIYLAGASLASISRKTNGELSAYRIKKILIENNIKLRTRHEQTIIENMKRGKSINHNYFSILNNENVYYLGFIAADGTVNSKRNLIKIGLSSIDKDFLVELRNKIQCEREVLDYSTQHGFQISELSFSSLKIKENLAQYSIIPNKTYTGITMKNVPQNLKLAFIKGYFDGDGSFSINKNTKQCKLSFISHTQGILEEIKEYFNINCSLYKDARNLWHLEYSTIPSLEIMKRFYDLDTPFLERKFNKYQEALKIRI